MKQGHCTGLTLRVALRVRRELALGIFFLPLGAVAQSPATPPEVVALRTEARTYEHGEGVPKDISRAIKLYCEGARKGDIESQYSLGWIYSNGRGVERDDNQAAYFFGLAAKLGDERSQRMLRYTGTFSGKPPACIEDLSRDFDQTGQALIEKASPEQKKIIDLALKLAPDYGVYPQFAIAIMRAESNFNPQAVSPKNAQGVMQLIPETSARFNVSKPFDPEQNIRGGLSYLRWLLAYFRGNVEWVAAAYNSGEKTVERYAGVPPYPETKDYVRRIKEIFKHNEHPYDPAVVTPSDVVPKAVAAAGKKG